MATEDSSRQTGQEDPTPLTDEEFEELQKKDKRTSGILAAIVDFITGFFH